MLSTGRALLSSIGARDLLMSAATEGERRRGVESAAVRASGPREVWGLGAVMNAKIGGPRANTYSLSVCAELSG